MARVTPEDYGYEKRSWWSRMTGGRGLMSLVFGDFLADKNNAASIVAIILVVTLCYIVAIEGHFEYATGLLNIVFVVIGYYFGSKRQVGGKSDDAILDENAGTGLSNRQNDES